MREEEQNNKHRTASAEAHHGSVCAAVVRIVAIAMFTSGHECGSGMHNDAGLS